MKFNSQLIAHRAVSYNTFSHFAEKKESEKKGKIIQTKNNWTGIEYMHSALETNA